MSSPPPTPSKRLPSQDSQRRFHEVGTPTEWIEEYRPGKFHPIHLGDLLDDSRYRIIRKLGYGSYSTVWLARDDKSNGYVALKILTADASSMKMESKVLRRSSEMVNDHPGRFHVISLLDTFEHKGPNGVHECLVFEVMGPSAASMVEYLPSILLNPAAPKMRYPTWMAKSILRQTLLGIDFLHQAGIVHGDLQPGNLLFPIKNLSQTDESLLIQRCDDESVSEPVRRLDEKVDPWAPRYLTLNQPLENFVYLEKDFAIKISDMGGAFFIDNPPSKLITPVSLRSPELIIGDKPSKDQDVWSFGCLFFEFITGNRLFSIFATGDEDDDDDHFLQFFDILGKLPDSILSNWSRSSTYFDSSGKQIKNYIGDLPAGFDSQSIPSKKSLEEFFDNERPTDMSIEDSKTCKRILRWILQYDATRRPSTKELLEDPWFTESDLSEKSSESDLSEKNSESDLSAKNSESDLSEKNFVGEST